MNVLTKAQAFEVLRRAYGPDRAESLAGRLPDRIDLDSDADTPVPAPAARLSLRAPSSDPDDPPLPAFVAADAPTGACRTLPKNVAQNGSAQKLLRNRLVPAG